jgi:hypothetical protein
VPIETPARFAICRIVTGESNWFSSACRRAGCCILEHLIASTQNKKYDKQRAQNKCLRSASSGARSRQNTLDGLHDFTELLEIARKNSSPNLDKARSDKRSLKRFNYARPTARVSLPAMSFP